MKMFFERDIPESFGMVLASREERIRMPERDSEKRSRQNFQFVSMF